MNPPLTPPRRGKDQRAPNRSSPPGVRGGFMAPMRGLKAVEASHEPERRSPDRPASRIEPQRADQEIGAPMPRLFMVAMRGQATVEALHEPPFQSGAKD